MKRYVVLENSVGHFPPYFRDIAKLNAGNITIINSF